MYWKVADHIDEHDNHWVGYMYFELVPVEITWDPWYNGIQREMVHPARYRLEVKAHMIDADEDFEEWYQWHKKL